MLMTPFTALAPQVDPAGPLMTSMRARSGRKTLVESQNTFEKSGEYTVRPSIITSSLLEKPLERTKPRALTAHWDEEDCATNRFVARRSNSGRVVEPVAEADCPRIKKISLAAWLHGSGWRDADNTCWDKSSSTLIRFKA